MQLSATQTWQGGTSWSITYLYDENGRPYAGVYRTPSTGSSAIIFTMVTTDRGDVVELLDAAGNPFVAYRYDPWGNPQGGGNVATGIWSQQSEQNNPLITAQQATDIANRQVLRYAAYCYDSESGFYYLSARSYDAETRQFLSKDASNADGEASAYQYCRGNPVSEIDLSGMYRQEIDFHVKRLRGILLYVDLNSYLRKVLRTNAGMAYKTMIVSVAVGGPAAQTIWFYEKVRNHGLWDVKWEDTTVSMTSFIYFDGQYISPDDFGNILFGYTGYWGGYRSLSFLEWAAHHHGRSNFTATDKQMVALGYNLGKAWGEDYCMPWHINEYVCTKNKNGTIPKPS